MRADVHPLRAVLEDSMQLVLAEIVRLCVFRSAGLGAKVRLRRDHLVDNYEADQHELRPDRLADLTH